MRKRRLTLRSQRHDPSRHAHARRFGDQFFGLAMGGLFSHLPRRVREVEPVRVGRVAQSLDFAQFLAALLILVQRFKFQRNGPFARGTAAESAKVYTRTPPKIPDGKTGVYCTSYFLQGGTW